MNIMYFVYILHMHLNECIFSVSGHFAIGSIPGSSRRNSL